MTSIKFTACGVCVGRLIEAKGEVLLKRQGWSDYHPTSVGTELYVGDLLQPAPGARVRVQCADGKTIWTVPAGEISGVTNGCPAQSIPVSRQSGDIISPRAGNDPLIPYIISPRRTALLTDKPILRWNAVPGATRYTVSLFDEQEEDIIWQTQVNVTEVVYPGEPSLKPGLGYLAIVKADTGQSSQNEGVLGQGFRRLAEDEAQQVNLAGKQLAQTQLTPEAQSLATAYLYIGYELRAEGIERLDALVQQGSQTAAVYRTLGRLYQEVGLNRLAESRYLRAVELAVSVGDVEGQAEVAVGLGSVYWGVGNQEAAIRWLTQARDAYAALGDEQRVMDLEAQLAELKS